MKFIDEPKKLQKAILKKTYLLALVPFFSLLIRRNFSALLGFIFGLFIATLILKLRLFNIKKSLDMSEEKAINFIRSRYLIEYITYFVVLFVAARNSSVNFLVTAAGLFLMKLTVIGWIIIDIVKENIKEKLEGYNF